jgi:glucose-1-phosphate cytidylyltransferase
MQKVAIPPDPPTAVILAGGRGTRLAEETHARPKPLVTIGGRPIIWHIMKHLSHHGINDFVIAIGYRGDDIKRYFIDHMTLHGDKTVRYADRTVTSTGEEDTPEPWNVRLIETGLDTQTGGRLLRLKQHLGDRDFLLTYGDGVCSVDVTALRQFHASHDATTTLTAVRPPARFGGLTFDGDRVTSFAEKAQAGEGWINGGFMMMRNAIFDHLNGDEDSLEYVGLEAVANEGHLAAFRHEGFWQCMDTVRDREYLEKKWKSGAAEWKVWS